MGYGKAEEGTVRFLGVVALVFLGACAPVVRSMMFVAPPPPSREKGHFIRFYRDERPVCAYEEIGLVTSRKPSVLVSMREIEESIRTRARRMGGDAVIGVTERTEMHGAGISRAGVHVEADPVYSGTVVRFVDPDCTH